MSASTEPSSRSFSSASSIPSAWCGGCSPRSIGSTISASPIPASKFPTGRTLLAPMATLLRDRKGPTVLSPLTMRSLLDSLASRLDEARDISRYLIGLLIFLGLLGTFWGLLETVQSVGTAIRSLDINSPVGDGVRGAEARSRSAARRHGHVVLLIAVRPCRLAGPGLSRPAGQPGAEPLLHRPRGLAVDDHRHRGGRPVAVCGAAISAARSARPAAGHRADEQDARRGAVGFRRWPGRRRQRSRGAWRGLPMPCSRWSSRCARSRRIVRQWAQTQSEQNAEFRRIIARLAPPEGRPAMPAPPPPRESSAAALRQALKQSKPKDE